MFYLCVTNTEKPTDTSSAALLQNPRLIYQAQHLHAAYRYLHLEQKHFSIRWTGKHWNTLLDGVADFKHFVAT